MAPCNFGIKKKLDESESEEKMKVLSAQEQMKLLGLVQEKLGLRNAVMIRMFLYTGARVSELCGLKFDDVFMGKEPKKYLLIRSDIAKGGIAREVPLSESLREVLRGYYQSIIDPISQESVDPGRPLFSQTKIKNMKLTPRQAQRIVRLAGELIGIADLHPHTLRHTFATALMRVTNMRTVQSLLGHKSLQSTAIYTHPTSDDMRKAVDNL